MTTEDAFQVWLNKHPDDHGARLVFADWLQDNDDERAEGYRALGAWRVRPTAYFRGNYTTDYTKASSWSLWSDENAQWPSCADSIPWDWFSLIPRPPSWKLHHTDDETRGASEDAAARAFARLPEARRAELLAAQPVAAH